MPGRTDQQCMGRWKRHLDPAICRAPWTAAEDALLTQLVAQHGHAWSTISSALEGRIAQQCRSRWKQLSTVCSLFNYKCNMHHHYRRIHRRRPRQPPPAPRAAPRAAWPTAPRPTAAARGRATTCRKRTPRQPLAAPRRNRPTRSAGGCSTAPPSPPAAAAWACSSPPRAALPRWPPL